MLSRSGLLVVLWATVCPVGAQEFPPPRPGTLFDCTQGCGLDATRPVRCWSFVQPATNDHGPRCQGYCQYAGMPAHCPTGSGWTGCASDAPAGVACNVTEYVSPPLPGRLRPRITCDAGTADALSEPCL